MNKLHPYDAAGSEPHPSLALICETIVSTMRIESLVRDPSPPPPYDVEAEWSVVAAILDGRLDPRELPIAPIHLQSPAAAASLQALLDGARTVADVAAVLTRERFPPAARDDLMSWAECAPVISQAQLVQRCQHVRELRRRARLVVEARAVADAICGGLSFDDGVARLRSAVIEARK